MSSSDNNIKPYVQSIHHECYSFKLNILFILYYTDIITYDNIIEDHTFLAGQYLETIYYAAFHTENKILET